MRVHLPSLVFLMLWLGRSPSVPAANEPGGQEAQSQEEQQDYFEKWVNEDVVYVITPEERDVFKSLATPAEKDQFIEQFWYRRDPDPLTEGNEFKEEHYRRLAYVNERFQSGVPGWKTDRGKIYIIHGPPAEIQKHQPGENYQRPAHEGGGFTAVHGFEIWRYRHIEGIGTDVEIEFVDPSGSGEYRLATTPWEKDAMLFVGSAGLTIAEELGLAAREDRPYFSPWNWDRYPGMTTRAKDNPFTRYATLVGIQRPPEIKFKDLKQLVDVNVSYDSLPFRTRRDYFRLNDESVLVPFTIEVDNRDLTFRNENGSMVARVELYGVVTSLTNRVIAEFEHDLSASCRPEQIEEGRSSRSLFQKVLILENRMRYRADVVVKDVNSENVGLVRVPIVPPKQTGSLALSSLILSDFIGQLPDLSLQEEMFVIGNLKVRPNLRNQFLASQPFGAYLQVYNVALDQASQSPDISVIYRIERGGRQIKYWSEDAGESVQFFSGDRLVLARALPLAQLEPDRYILFVTVEDRLTGEKAEGHQEFEVVPEKSTTHG